MKNNCSKYLGVVTSAGASDEHPMSTRSASDGRRWHSRGMQLICTLVLLFTFAVGQMWGSDVTIFSANFSDAVWTSHSTICEGSTAEETVEGILFRSNSSSKYYSVADGTLTFCNNNIGDNYYFLIHLEDVNGSVHVSFGTVSNSQRISYKWFEQTARPTSASSSTATAASINVNKEIALDYTMSGTGSDLWLMVGRQGSGQTTVIKTITITTPAASSVAPAITAPTADQSASYTVGDVITPLSVTATGSPTPTYQWYSNASASTTGATLITGAESASYTPSSAAESDLYFYCVATNSEGSAQSPYFHVEVNAAVATAPSFTSPASEPAVAEYFVGDVISALEVVAAGYPAPTLQWYSNDSKSTEGATLITGAESASYTPSSAAVSDMYFYCVATNASGTAQSEYFHVTVAPVSYCAELYPATSGASPTGKNQELLLQSEAPNASYGGKIYTAGAKDNNWSASFTYSANGLSLNKGGADSARVELTHLMKVGTVITATLVNPDANKARGYKLLNMAKSTKATWQATTTDPQVYTYTVVEGDGLAGTNMFLLQRAETSALKELKVSNCGDELFELSSAIDPAAAADKASVTLSKNLIAAGGSATATYTITDPLAYDFDEWVISGTGATLSDAKANPVTITMGLADAVVTLKLKAASVKHTVTYYDGAEDPANKLGEELIEHNGNPTGAGLAPHKLGYTFTGWSTTEDGSAATLSDINVTADMPLYAVWNAVNCATKSGTIYTMSIAVAPAANCTITSTTGTHDLYQYEGISGGEALLGNNGTSNNCILTTDKTIILKDDNSYIKLDFDCPLKEGDKIVYSVSGNNPVLSTGNSKPSTPLATLDRSKTEFVIPAESGLIDAQTVYVWKGGGNTTVTYINIIRPEKFAVTFNMHGHGTQVESQNIISGGKVTEPATTDITGWDFGGWFKTYVAEPESYSDAWDFENDVVSAAVELHAKWTAHVTSTDATLASLTADGIAATVDPLDATKYTVELPMGTSVAPTVEATPTDSKATATVTANTLSGATIVVVPESGEGDKVTYSLSYTIADSKDIELVWDKSKQRCDATTPDANVLIAAMSQYLSASYTGSAAEGGSLNTGKTTGSKIIITAKPGYAFKAMGFYGKIEDGTCNFYNDGVVETIGTSTGDVCYADVFSNDEVHEFAIELTGTNGVYIRNMQLTIIEACTPIVVAWDEEPIEFEVGKAGYAIAATANNGGAITYASADNTVIDVNASTGALTIAGLGSVALSASTPEGDGTTYCANGGDPIVLSKTVNTYYLVAFDGQNGEAADEVKYFSGDAAIAQPTDPSFLGHTFQGWFDAASAGNPVAFPLTPSASRTIYAQWTADCAGATITTQPEGTSYLTGRTATALVCEATAGNGGELTYEWFTCDDAMRTNPVAATATPSTAVAGTFYYFCKVTEEGCAVEAFSDVATIVVADKDPICLIATTVTGATAHGAVTGFLGEDRGGDAEVNVTKDSYKMDKGTYIGVTLPDGYKFQEGDKVVLNVMTVNNATGFTLFDGHEDGKNLIVDTRDGVLVPAGANTVVLPAYAGSQSVYVMRENNSTTGNLNSAIDAIAVYRACAPILNKVTVNGAEGKPNALKEVVFEVAASTSQSQLEAIAFDWVSNDDAWTADPANAPVAANAWEFGVANEVTFTDKDGDQNVYTITVNKAAASTNVELATLTVNGNAVTVVPGQAVYNYELPYGTSDAPAVAVTAEDANAEVGTITQAASATGSATFTVTAEDGTTTRDYTINFSVSKWKEIVIWDGSTMDEVATSPDATTGFAWETVGFGSISSYTTTYGEKSYSKYLPSSGSSTGRYMTLNVPEGYVAKFYIVMASHSAGNERGMFIGSNLVKDPDATSVLELSNSSRTEAVAGMSEVAGAGTWYINPNASIDFQEIRAYIRPGYVRTEMLGNGVLGTVCVDHNVAIEDIQGATFYELQGRDYTNYGKLAFDEITSGELEAGAPYVFQAHGDKLVLFYGETSVANPVDKGNGMYGTFLTIVLTELEDIYYFAQKALWSCKGAVDLTIAANRAYVKLSEVGEVSSMAPAPGRRRILMGVNGETQAQGFENIENGDAPMKVMIDGTLYILRGEKVFDATGRLVK